MRRVDKNSDTEGAGRLSETPGDETDGAQSGKDEAQATVTRDISL